MTLKSDAGSDIEQKQVLENMFIDQLSNQGLSLED